MNTADLVLNRRNIYGDYNLQLDYEAYVMSQFVFTSFKDSLQYQLSFSKIIFKLSRLATSPDHIDSWKDIAGYAYLMAEYICLKGESDEYYVFANSADGSTVYDILYATIDLYEKNNGASIPDEVIGRLFKLIVKIVTIAFASCNNADAWTNLQKFCENQRIV